MNYDIIHKGDMEYIQFPILNSLQCVNHIFTTKNGGVSEGIFKSMNFSIERGDSYDNILANYRIVADVLGCDIEDMVITDQTHTNNIRVVDDSDRGCGVVRNKEYTDVDGLITNTTNLCLVAFGADCVPIILVDPINRAVGVVHAGWRGTISGIASQAVSAMVNNYGCNEEDIIAVIAPSICGNCYEVGNEVYSLFLNDNRLKEHNIVKRISEDKGYLNLWEANHYILRYVGLKEDNIVISGLCTKENSDMLFSHRVMGFERGIMGAFIMLKE